MQLRLMMTDGGPHSPETLADWTASQLIDITAATAAGMSYNEAREFRSRLEKALVQHHDMAQSAERRGLQAEGSDRLVQSMPTESYVPDAADDVMAVVNSRDADGKHVFSATIRDHFAKPEARLALERMLHEHFHENMKIERSWHAAADADHPAAKAFIAVQRDGHAHLFTGEHDPELVAAMVVNQLPGLPPVPSEG